MPDKDGILEMGSDKGQGGQGRAYPGGEQRGRGGGRGDERGGGKDDGQRRGRGRGGAAGLGPGGDCVCLSCGKTVPHERGVPCAEMTCPDCGSPMTRKR